MPVSVNDGDVWNRYGWAVPWLPKVCQPDRKAALREEQARHLLAQCNLKSNHLGDQEALVLVTSTERAEDQTNG